MSDHLTDADLVARLKAYENGKAAGMSSAAIADTFGVKARSFLAALETARVRGLTAETVVVDPLAAAKARIGQLEAEVRGLRREHINSDLVRREIYKLTQPEPEPPKWMLRQAN